MHRVLLVDDDPAVRAGLRRMLSGHFSVDVAESAEEALAMLGARQYHAVLTDFDLGRENGLWILEQARARWPRMRRVLTSGRPPSEFEGATAVQRFLRKPPALADLLDALGGDAP